MLAGAILYVGDHRSPKRTVSEKLENAGQRESEE